MFDRLKWRGLFGQNTFFRRKNRGLFGQNSLPLQRFVSIAADTVPNSVSEIGE